VENKNYDTGLLKVDAGGAAAARDALDKKTKQYAEDF
jgi:hypothetical protein